MKNIHVLPTDKEPIKGDLLLRHEGTYTSQHKITYKHGFIDGSKWQQERSYSEEEVLNILDIMLSEYRDSLENKTDFYPASRFEKFKKK
jgi:hypothetical protein